MPRARTRYILGGAWNEPVYMFNDPDAQSPFARHPTYGFRCIKVDRPEDLSVALTSPIASVISRSAQGQAGQRAGLPDVAQPVVRVRPWGLGRKGAVYGRFLARVAPRNGELRRCIRRRTYPRLPLSPKERQASLPGGGRFLGSERDVRILQRQYQRLPSGTISSLAAGVPSCTRSTRARSSATTPSRPLRRT